MRFLIFFLLVYKKFEIPNKGQNKQEELKRINMKQSAIRLH